MAELGRLNVMSDLMRIMIERQEKIENSNPFGRTKIAEKYVKFYIDMMEFTRMINMVAVERETSEQLMDTVLDINNILSYEYPNPEVVGFFMARVQSAYFMAITESSLTAYEKIYNMGSFAIEQTTVMDKKLVLAPPKKLKGKIK